MHKETCDICDVRYLSGFMSGDRDVARFCGFCYIHCPNCLMGDQCDRCKEEAEQVLMDVLSEAEGEDYQEPTYE